MSSNPADLPPAEASASLPRRAWSLTRRLALLSTLSSFLILSVVSVQMYLRLADNLHEHNSLYLRDEAGTLTQLARLHGFDQVLAEELHVDPVGGKYLYHYIRLIDHRGERIAESPNMAAVLPPDLFPLPEKDGRPAHEVAHKGRNGASYIMTAVPVNWAGNGPESEVLQVALDVTSVEQIIAGYRYRLALTLAVGCLLCAAAGLLIAWRGTRPILEVTKLTRQITSASLDERLNNEGWPRELHDLAGALNGMLDRLQDSFSRMYNSAANLTHKLRTPLTIIIGQGEIALARERSVEELREVIASNVEECERISHLINNILLISQGETGKLLHVPVKFMAHAEIEKVLDFYGPLAEEKGITVINEANGTLTADPTLFRKAAAILLSNALAYTPAGGSVEISVRQGDDGSAEVRIADTGCGISAEELEKVYDMFYRVYATRSMDPHGSGLGLIIVKTIMNIHGGTINIMSETGQGTTVLLTFPQPAPAASPSAVK